MAINMWRVQADIEFTGDRAIDAVEDLAHNEPDKS